MPKEVLSELVFIIMMFVIILIGCGLMTYLFFRQYKREKATGKAKPPLAQAEAEEEAREESENSAAPINETETNRAEQT